MNLACKVLVKNKDDQKIREIFDYLCKVASYDKSLLIRQKARMLQHIFDSENNIDVDEIYKESPSFHIKDNIDFIVDDNR